MTKPEVGHFRAQGVPLKRKLREFPVTEDALIPVGTSIGVRHFLPGQFVDVTGITRGKGFQVRDPPPPPSFRLTIESNSHILSIYSNSKSERALDVMYLPLITLGCIILSAMLPKH